MKWTANKFKYLETSRYSVTTVHNGIEATQHFSVFASSNPLELFMAFPYTDLVSKLQKTFSIDDNPSVSAVQQYRNHLSALNSYLVYCGKTQESRIGTEFTSEFETKLRSYLSAIDVAPRTRRDRARLLKAIRRLFQATQDSRPICSEKQVLLSATLRTRIAETGVAPKTLAKQAGIDPTTLWRWLRGATPREDTIPSLHRLEVRLGLARDTLVQLIERHSSSQTNTLAATVPTHRLQMASRPRHCLTLAESELNGQFLKEWEMLFAYKTTNFPMLERQARAQWRLIPETASVRISKLARRGTMVCPTADIFSNRMRTFLGVVNGLALEDGGLGLDEPPEQTLAWCAHPLALECFLQWMTSRSGGIRHNGQKVFARAVASLLRPYTGFLWQQPGLFMMKLPYSLRPRDESAWQEMCAKSHKLLREYIRSSSGVARNPEEPIANLLAQQKPLLPIRDAISKIQAEAAASRPGGITEARHKRNALVLALMLSNPLRARTLVSLTWLPNGQGTLRGNPTEGWRIQLQGLHLKTGDSQRGRTYNVKVADWVKPMLDEYIEEHRETLLQGKSSPYLLVGDEEGGIWEGLGATVRKLTRRYIPGSPGFGPHAIRHLVATDWLRKHPDDYLTVAELLGDAPATVLAHYAHLRRDDSFARYEAYLNGQG